MKFSLFKPFTLEWWQVGIFKLSIASAGIFIGAKWANFFENYITLFLAIFIVTAIYMLLIWCKCCKP